MIKKNKQNKKKGGYAVLELLFYIAFFTLLSLVTIDAMIVMARSFKETSIQIELTQSGTIMERISREIRGSQSITSITSNATDLTLDSAEFKLSGTDLQFFENGVLVGNLNTPNTKITNVTFTKIDTAKGKAARILLRVQSKNDTLNRIIDFNDTIVLRNSYQ